MTDIRERNLLPLEGMKTRDWRNYAPLVSSIEFVGATQLLRDKRLKGVTNLYNAIAVLH